MRLWRGVHLTSYGMYAMATVHLLLSGTDRYNPVLRIAIVVSIGAVVFFTMYRLIGPGRAASVKSAGGRVRRGQRARRGADAARAAGSSRVPAAARQARADAEPGPSPDAPSDH